MVNHNPAIKIDQNRTPVLVNGQQQVASGRQIQPVNIGAMRKRQRIRRVSITLVSLALHTANYMTEATYCTRSKTDTRLPTGDSRQVPSGVKSRLPLRYTVPKRFENLKPSSAKSPASVLPRTTYLKIRLHREKLAQRLPVLRNVVVQKIVFPNGR